MTDATGAWRVGQRNLAALWRAGLARLAAVVPNGLVSLDGGAATGGVVGIGADFSADAPLDCRSLCHQALALAADLPPMMPRAARLPSLAGAGGHGRRRRGDGREFWQYRRSQPGDAASAIDWRQSARSSHLFVREQEWMVAQPVWLWVDGASSMAWRSSESLPSKRHRAVLIALALAAQLLQAGERVGVVGASMAPGSGVGFLPSLAEALRVAKTMRPDLPDMHARGGRVILISDFLPDPVGNTIAPSFRLWRENGFVGHGVQVLDPAEEEFPFQGRLTLVESEGNTRFSCAQAEAVQAEYLSRLRALRGDLANAASAVGWSFDHHVTGDDAAAGVRTLQRRVADLEG